MQLYLKERLMHLCFPVNFAKFPRTPFLQSTFRWLLLYTSILIQQWPLFIKHRKHSTGCFAINLPGFSFMGAFKDDKMYTIIIWCFCSYLTTCISFKILICLFSFQIHLDHNPVQNVVNKFPKLSKIGFCMKCFTAFASF